MSEILPNPIEQEIEALSREIDAKRKILESQRGIISEAGTEKELVRSAVSEKIQSVAPSLVPPPPAGGAPQKKASASGSYLDNLDPETTEKVNALIQEVFSKGIERAIKDAKEFDPYVIDAFHDALVDKLYTELRDRKVVE